jgi:hypothetical protein
MPASRAVSKAKGSLVWSMIPTVRPSPSSQIGRQCLSPTLMPSSLVSPAM